MPENDAAVLTDVAEDKVNAEESADAKAQEAGESGDPQAKAEHGDSQEEDSPEQKKRLGGWQRKIQKLERERDVWRDQVLSTRPPEPAKPAEKAAVALEAPKRPKLEEFDGTPGKTWKDYEDARDKYVEELAEFKAKAFLSKAREEEQQKSAEQTARQKWQEQEAKTAEKYADYKETAVTVYEAFEKHIKTSTAVVNALSGYITESGMGPELIYHLGQHPEEIEKLAALPVYDAIYELGTIKRAIANQKSEGEAEKVERKETTAPVSKAPKPPTPSKKSGPVDDGELRDDLPTEEWSRRYRAKMEKR